MKYNLTSDQIESINEKCPTDQGIFREPYGIPVSVKELVIYCRYETGGNRGGSYGGTKSYSYTEPTPRDRMKVLDLVLKEIYPSITFLQFKEIDDLIQDNKKTDQEYYGNSTDYKIEYIVLSGLLKLLESF